MNGLREEDIAALLVLAKKPQSDWTVIGSKVAAMLQETAEVRSHVHTILQLFLTGTSIDSGNF
jgi:hypothetical protein